MSISYKYRIYPNKATEQKLNEALDTCRWLYNRLLQEMNEAKERGVTLGKLDAQIMISSLKLENPDLQKSVMQVLAMKWEAAPFRAQ